MEVLEAMQELNHEDTPASCEAVCERLGYTANRVTGRIKELRDKGMIVYDSFTKSRFGKSVETYKIKSIKGQGALL